MQVKELAKKLNLEFVGDGDTVIKKISDLENSDSDSIVFIQKKSFEIEKIKKLNFACMIVSQELKDKLPSEATFILAPEPIRTLVQVVEIIHPQKIESFGISASAQISSSAKIGKNVSIGHFVSIADEVEIEDNVIIFSGAIIYPKVKIGKNTVIHSNCTIREQTIIGEDCIIYSGAVLGTDGFGYISDPTSGLKMVPQIGKVVLGKHVHVGSNTCIDRGTFGDTKIGEHTKIDNHVQIGHNVKIGNYCLICGKVGIAGSVEIGNQCVIGGAVGIADHFKVVDKVRVGAGSMILTDLLEPGDYFGIPAIPALRGKRNVMALANLADTIKKLQKQANG